MIEDKDSMYQYQGGIVLWPFSPCISNYLLSMQNDKLNQTNVNKLKYDMITFFKIVSENLIEHLIHYAFKVRDFLFILYPVPYNCRQWLTDSNHIQFLLDLSSLMSQLLNFHKNINLDIRILPIMMTCSNQLSDDLTNSFICSCLSDLQVKSLVSIFQNDDLCTMRFVNSDKSINNYFFSYCSQNLYSLLKQNEILTYDRIVLGCVYPLLFQETLQNELIKIFENIDIVTYNNLSKTVSNEKSSIFFKYLDHCNYDLSSPVSSLFIGGTFDHLHLGHKFLLNISLFFSVKKLIIGVVKDHGILMNNKQYKTMIQPSSFRIYKISEYMNVLCGLCNQIPQFKICLDMVYPNVPLHSDCIKYSSIINANRRFYAGNSLVFACLQFNKALPMIPLDINDCLTENSVYDMYSTQSSSIVIECLCIDHPVQPVGDRLDILGIVATQDTLRGALSINQYRESNGLNSLKIIILPLIYSIQVKDIQCLSKYHSTYLLDSFDKNLPYELDNITLLTEKNSIFQTSSSNEMRIHNKKSSTFIRYHMCHLDSIYKLSNYWNMVASGLHFPDILTHSWGIRLVELYNDPWRTKNKFVLHNIMKNVWDTYYTKEMNQSTSSSNAAWIYLVLWFLLLCINCSHQLSLDHLLCSIIHMKYSQILQLFVSDLYICGSHVDTDEFFDHKIFIPSKPIPIESMHLHEFEMNFPSLPKKHKIISNQDIDEKNVSTLYTDNTNLTTLPQVSINSSFTWKYTPIFVQIYHYLFNMGIYFLNELYENISRNIQPLKSSIQSVHYQIDTVCDSHQDSHPNCKTIIQNRDQLLSSRYVGQNIFFGPKMIFHKFTQDYINQNKELLNHLITFFLSIQ